MKTRILGSVVVGIGIAALAFAQPKVKSPKEAQDFNAIQQATTSMHGAPTITMTVGGTACTSDSSCATALGTATQPPPSGTQATVSLTYALPVLAPGSLPRSIASMLPSNVVATMSNYVQ